MDSPRVDFDESVRAFLRKYSWDAHTSKHLKYLEIPAYDLEQGLAVDDSCQITDQKVSDAEAMCLAKALRLMEPENMKSIYLTNNKIGDEGAAALAAAVVSVPHLEKLFLAGNHIGDAGLAAIADRCASTALSQLVLSENASLGDEGAIALARAVTSDPSSSFASLQWLYLDSSAISDKGVDALAKALVTGMKRLERLALQNCKLTNKGARARSDSRPERMHHTTTTVTTTTTTTTTQFAVTTDTMHRAYTVATAATCSDASAAFGVRIGARISVKVRVRVRVKARVWVWVRARVKVRVRVRVKVTHARLPPHRPHSAAPRVSAQRAPSRLAAQASPRSRPP